MSRPSVVALSPGEYRSSRMFSPFRRLVRLDDGTVGYCMDPRRIDDCLRPAIATVLQLPIEQVPDPQLARRMAIGIRPERISRESWAALDAWLHDRDLALAFHDQLPLDHERWIGVCRAPEDDDGEPFADHCVVMSRDRIMFDPAIGLKPPPGMCAYPYVPSDVIYGITFEPRGA